MRRWGLLGLVLLMAACNRDKQLDRNANVAKVDLNQVVARASAKAGVEHPDAHAMPAQPQAGYAWVGDWARRRALCPFRPWRLTRSDATVPRNTSCRIMSAKDDPLGGDRLTLACTTAGMKTDEIWFVKFSALNQIRITRTAGPGVPTVVTLERCG